MQQSLKVFVLERRIAAQLLPDAITVGIGSPVALRVLVEGVEPARLEWSCRTLETSEECANFVFVDNAEHGSDSQLSRLVEFYAQGK